MATAKKKITFNQVRNVTGFVAALIGIGVFVHSKYKAAKEKKEKGVNGAGEVLYLDTPEDYYHPYLETEVYNEFGMNGLEMSDIDADVALF